MFIIGPIWFVLLMMFIFGRRSKEERWLAQKQKEAIRELMEEERRLTPEEPIYRRLIPFAIVALIILFIRECVY